MWSDNSKRERERMESLTQIGEQVIKAGKYLS